MKSRERGLEERQGGWEEKDGTTREKEHDSQTGRQTGWETDRVGDMQTGRQVQMEVVEGEDGESEERARGKTGGMERERQDNERERARQSERKTDSVGDRDGKRLIITETE
jgi:hypothetical protein